ncbi:MAG: glycoside hydrolase [Aequorivita sp.]|nr:glycoside hydrolase [Aequorivita sp.]
MTVSTRSLACIFLIPIFFGCLQRHDSSKILTDNSYEKVKKEVTSSKINGVSFVASGDSILQQNIVPLKKIKANYAAIMPFGFIKSIKHPEIIYNQKRQWFGETRQGAKQYIGMLHKSNIAVMMKPQIWVWNGEFTGLVKMASEADWLELENSYRSFITDFAKVAEEENVEILCIGTELEKFIEHRPEYWRNLIEQIRTIYKGKLTYAANWDEYKRVPFWDVLDYIGVDAYFPVSESKTPTVAEARDGWQPWKEELRGVSEKENKKILFTEYGYRSVDFAGREPWESDHTLTSMNFEAQSNTLQALYEEAWSENWFAGGFLWKWFIAHERVGGTNDNQFTPQNKPAETIVKEYYSKE